MQALINIIRNQGISATWSEDNKKAFDELFGGPGGRYPVNAKNAVAL
jgi:hypothetical protein